jgi:diacylglycerol kinase family enzyme
MRRVLFFLNPLLTGRGGRRAVVDRCATLLREDGCTVEMQDTLSAYSAGDQARDAVASGFDTIFACGGDGTFFQVLQGVAGSDVALGIIPFGTGNVLAQNLRLPRDPLAALRAQKNGNSKAVSIPLGEVRCGTLRDSAGRDERRWYFTIAAGLGVHAALMDIAPNGNGKRFWGRTAYYADGVRLLLGHPIQPFDVEMTGVDGTVRRFRACEMLGVRVAEINRWRPGGDLCSSRLRMAAVPQTSRLGLAHAMFHALFTQKNGIANSGGQRLPYPQYEDVAQIVCRRNAGFSYAAPLLVEADGEVVGVDHATFRMAKKQLRLLLPNELIC